MPTQNPAQHKLITSSNMTNALGTLQSVTVGLLHFYMPPHIIIMECFIIVHRNIIIKCLIESASLSLVANTIPLSSSTVKIQTIVYHLLRGKRFSGMRCYALNKK